MVGITFLKTNIASSEKFYHCQKTLTLKNEPVSFVTNFMKNK